MSRFEWDDEKARSNLRKHGVAFGLLEHFEFETAIEWIDDRDDHGEERIIIVGVIGSKLFTLVYTLRGTTIRVISLRKASKKEVDKYVKSHF